MSLQVVDTHLRSMVVRDLMAEVAPYDEGYDFGLKWGGVTLIATLAIACAVNYFDADPVTLFLVGPMMLPAGLLFGYAAYNKWLGPMELRHKIYRRTVCHHTKFFERLEAKPGARLLRESNLVAELRSLSESVDLKNEGRAWKVRYKVFNNIDKMVSNHGNEEKYNKYKQKAVRYLGLAIGKGIGQIDPTGSVLDGIR